MPDVTRFTCSIIFNMICSDFFFYFSHKLLHWGPLYQYVHKIHHSYTYPVGICASYSHPFEYYFSGVLSSSLGNMILKRNMHITTGYGWAVFIAFESMEGHCGYEFPWSPFRLLPMSNSARYHDYHHSHNIGNYSSLFSFWDTIFGSNRDYFNYIEQQEKEQ